MHSLGKSKIGNWILRGVQSRVDLTFQSGECLNSLVPTTSPIGNVRIASVGIPCNVAAGCVSVEQHASRAIPDAVEPVGVSPLILHSIYARKSCDWS